MMRTMSILAALLLAAAPCLSQSLEWLDRVPALYPSKLYLTALGVGSTKEAADNEAYKGISRIFKAEVEADSRQVEAYRQGAGSEGESVFSFDESINVRTSSVLESVTIARHGYDGEKDRFYSLAVLDKREYSEILAGRIAEADGRLEKLLASVGEPGESVFLRFRTLLRARLLAVGIAEAYRMLGIVGDRSQVESPETTVGDVDRMLAEFTTNDARIGIRVEGELAGELEDLLVDALNDNGIHVSSDPGGSGSDLLFDCDLRVRESGGRTGRRFTTLRWTFSVKLRDLASGNVIFSEFITGENTSNDREMALDRVLYAFETDRIHDVIGKIYGYFYEE